MNKTTNNVDLKRNNILSILKYIKIHPNITKTELAVMSGMTIVTVHNFITKLLEKKICIESGVSPSQGGRKSMQYSINPNFGLIISIFLSRFRITTTVYNLDLNEIYNNTLPCDINNIDNTVARLLDEADKCLLKTKDLNMPYLGLGLTIPGRVNEEGEIIMLADVPGWENYSLKNILSARYMMPIHIDNDNNAFVLSTKWNGRLNSSDEVIFLSTTEGVGVGILTEHGIVRGTNYQGCEIGHTIINFNGELCTCGNKGCIQAYLSDVSIRKKLSDSLPDKYNNLTSFTEIARIVQNERLEKAYEVFKSVVNIMAITIHNLVMSFDPNIIIINSSWLTEMPELFEKIKQSVYKTTHKKNLKNLKIVLNNNKLINKIAPAYIVLEALFENSDCSIFLNN